MDSPANSNGDWQPSRLVTPENSGHASISRSGTIPSSAASAVAELIEIAGGEDALPDLRYRKAAKDRIVTADAVRIAAPDVILASWCGKKVVPEKIRQRPGWNEIPAIRHNRIVEIKSPLILQPGPAALTDGLDAIVAALWPEA